MINIKINKLREYFNKCEILNLDSLLNVDYFSDGLDYTIYLEPSSLLVKRYVDGEEIRQQQFSFIILNEYTAELANQLANVSFNDNLIEWIETNNDNGILPDIKGAIKVEVLGNGFASKADNTVIQYQIPMRLIYKR